jgi:hypothetical protein
MAHASRKHFGPGAQDHGKGDGSGAMTEIGPEDIPENSVLSNRDKARHSDQRGLDSRAVQTEQFHEHAANQSPDDEADEQ